MGLSVDPIQQFFREFEHNSHLADIAASVSQFADVFMAAGPTGAIAVRAGDFAQALPKRKQLFDRLGCRSTALENMRQTRLDERYTLVETEWRMDFALAGRQCEQVRVGSTMIVFYLSHQDIMAILKERGILTA